jgi:dolichyl-phosphate-mannose-protein mannosyltransferase
LFFGHPGQAVFDEVHFGKFVSGYYTHEYFFDIHPPLGKLIIAGFGKLFDFEPNFSFAQIGNEFPDKKYMALRFLPSLAGALLPIVIFLFLLQLGLKSFSAFMGGILVILENAILIQSRFILLDAFLLLFGFTALMFYFYYRNMEKYYFLALAGAFSGLAMSIKWTGVAFLSLIGIIALINVLRTPERRKIIAHVLSLVLLPLVLYFLVFAVHFSLLTKTGNGDAFMSPEFQGTLEGNMHANNTSLEKPNVASKFFELNAQMYLSNQRLTATHPYSSKWYTWPFMARPIFYWVDRDARIYLFGNPIIWWLSTVAVISMIFFMILSRNFRKDRIAWVLMGGYLVNVLPFIGITRVMFLYHYMTALLFAILIMVYIIQKTQEKPARIFLGLMLLAIVSFIYFAPLTYGLNMDTDAYNKRAFMKSWK